MIRYSRQIQLKDFGTKKQEMLLSAKVLVVGAGGLGVPVLQYLTSMGTGTIGIVENDTVSLTNLQRQVIYTEAQAQNKDFKLEAAVKRLQQLNSQVHFKTFPTFLNHENALAILQDFDLVIDCSDNFATRYLINDACVMLKKPFIYGALHGFEGHVSVFNYKNGPTYRCLFPVEPDAKQIPDCNTNGVLGVIPGIIGNLQALEAVKLLTGIGSVLSGELLIYDGLAQQIRKIRIPKSPENLKITALKPITIHSNCESSNYNINAQELKKLITKNPGIQLVDVRTKAEYDVFALKPSINIPLDQLPQRFNDLKTNQPVYVLCESGIRSNKAISLLKDWNTNLEVYHLEGGLKKYRELTVLHSS